MERSNDADDRRAYCRQGVDIRACLFCEGLNREIKSRLCNICERGMCVEAKPFDGYETFIHKGKRMKVLFMDSFSFGDDIESDVLNVDCTVRHVKEEDERIVIGCYVYSRDFEKYVQHREISRFLCNVCGQ